jgi:hypothetical protein
MPSRPRLGGLFPPRDLAKALKFFITDLPTMLIRERPTRTAPIVTKRPSLRYKTRSRTDPGTTVVTRTIELHLLTPPPPC